MMRKYSSFYENLLLEKVINESIIYFSPKLRNIISSIDTDISKELLEIESEDIKSDITFVDLDKDRDEYLTFTNMSKAKKNLLSKYPDHIGVQNIDITKNKTLADDIFTGAYDLVYNKSRNPIRLGKFVNKVLNNKKESEVEDFVNKFKSAIENAKERFSLVSGDDIAKYYNYNNYYKTSGSLGNSCMRHKQSYIFDIYTKNPEVCKLLVLFEEGKVKGRSLVWKLDTIDFSEVTDVYFMDRQYTVNDSDVEKFRNYAKENGWYYKTYNRHDSLEFVSTSDSFYSKREMTVKLNKDINYKYFPYLDTFRRFDPNTKILYNDNYEDSKFNGNYILNSTDGGYTEISSYSDEEDENQVYSEWLNSYIDRESSVWSDYLDSYLIQDDSVNVTIGSDVYRGWYPADHDDIVYDNYIDRYLNINDAVYSENTDSYIFIENAVEVINNIYSDGDAEYDSNWYYIDDYRILNINDINKIWVDRLTDMHSVYNNCNYLEKELLLKDYKGEWILKEFMIKLYKIIEAKPNSIDIKGVDYLSEIDAKILGYKIDKNDMIISDKFEYNLNIDFILKNIIKKGNYIINELEGKSQLKIKFDTDYNDDVEKNKIIYKIRYRIDEIESEMFSPLI